MGQLDEFSHVAAWLHKHAAPVPSSEEVSMHRYREERKEVRMSSFKGGQDRRPGAASPCTASCTGSTCTPHTRPQHLHTLSHTRAFLLAFCLTRSSFSLIQKHARVPSLLHKHALVPSLSLSLSFHNSLSHKRAHYLSLSHTQHTKRY